MNTRLVLALGAAFLVIFVLVGTSSSAPAEKDDYTPQQQHFVFDKTPKTNLRASEAPDFKEEIQPTPTSSPPVKLQPACTETTTRNAFLESCASEGKLTPDDIRTFVLHNEEWRRQEKAGEVNGADAQAAAFEFFENAAPLIKKDPSLIPDSELRTLANNIPRDSEGNLQPSMEDMKKVFQLSQDQEVMSTALLDGDVMFLMMELVKESQKQAELIKKAMEEGQMQMQSAPPPSPQQNNNPPPPHKQYPQQKEFDDIPILPY